MTEWLSDFEADELYLVEVLSGCQFQVSIILIQVIIVLISKNVRICPVEQYLLLHKLVILH